MKKIITIIVTIAMAVSMFSLISCNKEEPAPVQVTQEEFTETINFALQETGKQVEAEMISEADKETNGESDGEAGANKEEEKTYPGLRLNVKDGEGLVKGAIYVSPFEGAMTFTTDLPFLGKDTVYFANGKILNVLESLGASTETTLDELWSNFRLSNVLDEKADILTKEDGEGKTILDKLSGDKAVWIGKLASAKAAAKDDYTEILEIVYKYVTVVSTEKDNAIVYSIETDSASVKAMKEELLEYIAEKTGEEQEATEEQEPAADEENRAVKVSLYLNKETSFIMNVTAEKTEEESTSSLELYLGESFKTEETRYLKVTKDGETAADVVLEKTETGKSIVITTKERTVSIVLGNDNILTVVSEITEGETKTEEFNYSFNVEFDSKNLRSEMEKWKK